MLRGRDARPRIVAVIAAGFTGVMPVSALLLSYAPLAEPFRWIHPVGFATVIVGVLLVPGNTADRTDEDGTRSGDRARPQANELSLTHLGRTDLPKGHARLACGRLPCSEAGISL